MELQALLSEAKGILQRLDFPAQKQEVVDHAEQQGASADVLGALRQLPEETYKSAEDILQKIPKVSLSDLKSDIEDIL